MTHCVHRNVLIAMLPAVAGSAVRLTWSSSVNSVHPLGVNGGPDRLHYAAPGFIYADSRIPHDRGESWEHLENFLGHLAGCIYASAADPGTLLMGLLSTCADTGDCRLTIVAILDAAPARVHEVMAKIA